MTAPRCPGCGALQRAADDVLDWYHHDARGLDGGDVMRALDAALSAASVRAGVDGLDRECVRAALGAWVGTSEIDDESVDTFSAAYKAALSAPDPGEEGR
jgi:hypothetical protein